MMEQSLPLRSADSSRPLRILSLDGGGVKGITSLLILQEIFKALENRSGRHVEPHEYFDLIAGTSTGGLIALMLGRLRMPIELCLEKYEALSKNVFPRRKWPESWKYATAQLGKPWYDANTLEAEIEKVLSDIGQTKDATLQDESGCKVFVCAALALNSLPQLLRSYKTNVIAEVNYDCTIVEAARATSAAPLFFTPVTLKRGGSTFVDGGLRANNPISFAFGEARHLWPSRSIGCVISIGTGKKEGKPFESKIRLNDAINTLIAVTFDAPGLARAFLSTSDGRRLKREGAYYRFNVEQGLSDVEFDESKKIPMMKAATRLYIADQVDDIFACAERMYSEKGLHFKESGLNDSFLSMEDLQDLHTEFEEHLVPDLKEWIQPPNHASDLDDLHEAISKQSNSSTNWVFSLDQFKDWRNGHEKVLWICGRPGCGKSTIAASIVKRLQTLEMAPSIATNQEIRAPFIGFAFCAKLNNSEKAKSDAVQRIFLWQSISGENTSLSPQQKRTILSAWRSSSSARTLQDNTIGNRLGGSELYHLLRTILRSFQHTVLVLDGLDECLDHENLLEKMRDLVQSEDDAHKVQIIFVSQKLPSIIRQLESTKCIIDMEQPEVRQCSERDISLFVGARLAGSVVARGIVDEIKTVICSKAEGMFLWGTFAVEKVIQVAKFRTDAEVLQAARELPTKMSDIFLSLLQRVLGDDGVHDQHRGNDKKDLILAALRWTFHTTRPLEITELCEAMMLPHDTEIQLPKLSGFVLDTTTLRHLLGLCYPILYLSKNTVHIMHSMLKEFVTPNLTELRSIEIVGYLGTPEIQARIVKCSLEYLSRDAFDDFIEVSRTESILLNQAHPYLRYAVSNWVTHLMAPNTYLNSISELLSDFLESDNAVTWIELWVDYVNTDLTSLQAQPFSRVMSPHGSSNSSYVTDNAWITNLLRRSISVRRITAKNAHMTIELMSCLASMLKDINDLKDAEQLARDVYEWRVAHPVENTFQSISAGNILAMILSDMGKWDEAERIFEKLLMSTKATYGAQSRHRLAVVNNLASLLSRKGEHSKAHQLHWENFEARLKVVGEEHPETVLSHNNLAATNLALGDYKKAQYHAVCAQKSYAKNEGSGSRHELLATNNLARAEAGLGNREESRKLSERAWRGREQILGPAHPDTLISKVNYATELNHLELHAESEALLRSVITQHRKNQKLLPGQESSLLTAMSNLAVVLNKRGRYDESILLDAEILNKRREALGESHPDTLLSTNNLCWGYMTLGQTQKAKRLLISAFNLSCEKLGTNHRVTMNLAESLSWMCQNIGMQIFTGYLAGYWRRFLRTSKKASHPDVIRWDLKYAFSLSRDGRWEQAELLLSTTLKSARKYMGRNHSYVLGAQLVLVDLWIKRGDLERAETTALAARRQASQTESEPSALWTIEIALARIYRKQGRSQEALTTLTQVRDSQSQKLDAQSFQLANVDCNIAEVHAVREDYAQAEAFAQRALQVFEATLDQTSLAIAWAKQIIATSLRMQGRFEESFQFQTASLDGRQKAFGSFHFLTLKSKHERALLLFETGDLSAAVETIAEVVQGQITVLGPDHPDLLSSLRDQTKIREKIGLASYQGEQNGVDLGPEPAQEEARLLKAIDEATTLLESQSLFLSEMVEELADHYRQNANLPQAELLKQQVFASQLRARGPSDMKTLQSLRDIIDLAAETHSTVRKDLIEPGLIWSIKANDITLLEKLLDAQLDPAFRDPETNYSALGLAVKKNSAPMVRALLSHGADIGLVEHDGKMVLHIAVEDRNIELMRCLLEAGANANSMITDKKMGLLCTPLSYAAKTGSLAAVDLLLEYKAELDSVQLDLKPMHVAALNGQTLIVLKLLEEGVNIETKTASYGGITPLGVSALLDTISSVEVLLDKGADARYVTTTGNTLLHLACEGGNTEIVKIFLNISLNLRDVNLSGSRPIHLAAMNGRAGLLETLLAADPDVSIHKEDAAGGTPLTVAAARGHIAFVQGLLDRNADPNIAAKNGRTALHNAAEAGHMEVMEALLRARADPNIMYGKGITPLTTAIIAKRLDVIDRLLRAGAKATGGFTTVLSPMAYAVYVGDAMIIKALLKSKDTDVSAPSIHGLTPIVLATMLHKLNTITLLVENNADPSTPCINGQTALHYAARTLQYEAMKCLISAGAKEGLKDCWGRKPLDWVGRDDQALKLFTSRDKTPPSVQQSVRAQTIVKLCNDIRKGKTHQETFDMLARAFLLSEKEVDASIALEMAITNASQADDKLLLGDSGADCNICKKGIVGTFRICKICANCTACSNCYTKYQQGEHPRFCDHDNFLHIPRPCWRQLPPGIVNPPLETRDTWLQRVEATYSRDH